MTKSDAVSYKELYQLIDERTAEIMASVKQVDVRVGVIEQWKEGLKAQMVLMAGIFSFVVAAFWDLIRKRFE